jgi:hypothetical protein
MSIDNELLILLTSHLLAALMTATAAHSSTGHDVCSMAAQDTLSVRAM